MGETDTTCVGGCCSFAQYTDFRQDGVSVSSLCDESPRACKLNETFDRQLVVEVKLLAFKGTSFDKLFRHTERLVGSGSVRFDDRSQFLYPLAGAVPRMPSHAQRAVRPKHTITFSYGLFGFDPMPSLQTNNGVNAVIT